MIKWKIVTEVKLEPWEVVLYEGDYISVGGKCFWVDGLEAVMVYADAVKGMIGNPTEIQEWDGSNWKTVKIL